MDGGGVVGCRVMGWDGMGVLVVEGGWGRGYGWVTVVVVWVSMLDDGGHDG